jgi:hypothetical protein
MITLSAYLSPAGSAVTEPSAAMTTEAEGRRELPHAVDFRVEEAFYERCLRVLSAAGVPFLAGGSYALMQYCNVLRGTKDLDLFLRQRDCQRALDVLHADGCFTEVPYPHWLAKAHYRGQFIDIIYNSGNGRTPVDDAWFDNATPTTLFGVAVALCPVEETIWSKSFVMERERYDGADVAHLIMAQGQSMDWHRLIARYGDDWPILLGHLVIFSFIYPDEPSFPRWVMAGLLARARRSLAQPRTSDAEARHLCRGTLLSREQYLSDLMRGFDDARLPPHGKMSPEAIDIWTKAIQKLR